MSLINYKPATREIPLSDNNSVFVRGLNSQDLTILIDHNSEALEKLVSIFEGAMAAAPKSGKTEPAALDSFMDKMKSDGLELIRRFPELSVMVIALAAEEEASFTDLLTHAAKLTAPMQAKLVMTIVRLTFEEVGGVKKFLDEFQGFRNQVKRPASMQA